ncbi:hypothetical protein A2239_04765 [Candidatus Uhrbacteria bacterium RIFOXYA2_FULL_40_9]|nr:MAG: hypothetical protein A2239_04765 [Candidatus Uhrbacteria bacterium RIFOXYA2_FULL_40_9]OGL96831.1 MAG: hypothetical protein A2332_02230 [Candidatus Uhrbacteria bacterium RIFOXYB2_FULL_41_18]HBK34911.1 hypothetical protein [Candidatus Uhrbacteria bacterium]HCB55521.1 hypothetical protein [Candidatus Uhrbacteria bacterium]
MDQVNYLKSLLCNSFSSTVCMPENEMPRIQLPPNTQKPATTGDSLIFTMPSEYRHGASGTIKQKEVISTPVKKTLPPEKKKELPKMPAQKPSGKRVTLISKKLIIVGAIVIVGFAIAGFILVKSLPKQEDISQEPVTTARPPQQTEEVIPPIEEVFEEPVIEEPSDLFTAPVSPGKDSDSDGLTDLEETLIYGTDSRLPDTDADGFLDGNEVFHGYHPKGLSPLTLLDSKTVTVFTWAGNFFFYHPTTWSLEETDEIRLESTTGEQFYLSLIDRSLEDVTEEFQREGIENVYTSVTKQGYQMLITEDQLKAYVEIGERVYRFRYDTGIKGTVDYLQTFQMMLNSFSFFE